MLFASSSHHSWRIRLYVGIAMFLLAAIGVILTNIQRDGAWDYWRIVSIVFALLSLSMSGYFRRRKWTESIITLWHEVLHWAGLVFSILLLSSIVNLGIIGRYEASLQILMLLALATYLAGVYIDMMFLFLGGMLGLFAIGLSLMSVYLYSVVLPIAVLIMIVFFRYIRKKSHPSLRE